MSQVELTIGMTGEVEVASTERLRNALDLADGEWEDAFVILAKADQEYRQCLHRNGWILEQRMGGDDQHFVASRRQRGDIPDMKKSFIDRLLSRSEPLQERLSRDDVDEAMTRYLDDSPDPDWLVWTKISV